MTNRTTSRALAAATALLALGAVAGCSTGGPAGADPQRVDVVAAFYPLQFLAERVGGDDVRVTNLAKPGAEPHDLELSPRQVGDITEAELIVYLKGFQPAVDEAIAQDDDARVFDVASVQPLLDASAGGHNHEGEEEQGDKRHEHAKDPHVWLDPTRLAAIGDQLAHQLGTVDPSHTAGYTARAASLRADLTALDGEFSKGLATCQRREIVTSHAAFGYLADRYRLQQVGITGLSPDVEPSPQRLAQVVEEAKEHRASTIFFESLVSPKVAETIAGQVGAKTAVLDPIEGLAPGSDADYFSVMRTNLQTLRTALSCS